MITVFYDGICGLCSKEINHYRSIAPEGLFNWQDITTSSEQLNKRGVSLAQGLKRLHATDDNGKIHIGADAFILIWRQLPRWKWLATIVALPGIRQFAHWIYAIFADWKFKRAKHCQYIANDTVGQSKDVL